MNKNLIFGFWKHLIPIPRRVWQEQVAHGAKRAATALAFMSPDHHKVRDFVVLELPKTGAPLSPETIASRVALPLLRTRRYRTELEKHLTFLFRNEQGAVAWAYPVTVEPTPHRLTFSTGEQVYAA